MKKLIAVLTLFLAFAFNANAQEDKKMDAVNAAKLDAVKMSQSLNLTAEQQDQFVNLFVMKHQAMSDATATDAKKKEITQVMDAKIRATLTSEQMAKLDADPALLAQLTGTDKLPVKKDKK
jgi:hypothetical protein